MTRALLLMTAVALLAGCNRAATPDSEQNAATAKAGPPPQYVGETPMAERVAVIGLLNKRNGIVRNLTMRPGDAIKIRDAVVRLRACETTAPWESPPLTGAFVQVDVEQPNRSWNRVFSGWLYKESPSLNVVEHQVYDVWPKSCTMTWPGAPGKLADAATAASAAPVRSASKPSNAKKSGADAASPPVTDVPPRAADAVDLEPSAELNN